MIKNKQNRLLMSHIPVEMMERREWWGKIGGGSLMCLLYNYLPTISTTATSSPLPHVLQIFPTEAREIGCGSSSFLLTGDNTSPCDILIFSFLLPPPHHNSCQFATTNQRLTDVSSIQRLSKILNFYSKICFFYHTPDMTPLDWMTDCDVYDEPWRRPLVSLVDWHSSINWRSKEAFFIFLVSDCPRLLLLYSQLVVCAWYQLNLKLESTVQIPFRSIIDRMLVCSLLFCSEIYSVVVGSASSTITCLVTVFCRGVAFLFLSNFFFLEFLN